ncbi:TlpA disulfide reductase family protein [Sediminibacter sp. Hel_I_10]|uniref:TlpA family protein disulfide reductase n=1 Tax=Sediminibacter sp. Hel_I_10 TaxID=1392490 RepID=UPI00055DBE44|nr:TlpA disulfide reductase family protein [Sediminibacter sp. Hel_I_10]
MARSRKQIIVNSIFVIIILIMIIPQTRMPIQILLQKGLSSVVQPSILSVGDQKLLSHYDWKLKDVNGKDIHLSEGKVMVINFWATWCPPCIAEMSSFEKLYEHYKDNNAVVFIFASQEETEIVEAFMKKKGYALPYYRPMTNPPKEFNVSSIPRTFVVDRFGTIVLDHSGVANWDSQQMRDIIDGLIR